MPQHSAPTDSPPRWQKSRHSNGDGGACIEFAPEFASTHGIVPVRDSKNPDGPQLHFTSDAWASFAAAAQGDFGTV
ncbi:DUF397 domain-containing protein [Kitasatospora sp. GP82]|uniref:DUF397 domain-containing protein n=1 Tax=Kitasatospora sp. GP82 TaxID=3035089 RepID=UPI0024748C27|nr:DUF397 domain-containing protein [Kitasatospora sp. GP82]MDH6128973.1 hypothetical protein [Kitasatospora sp. GP82]